MARTLEPVDVAVIGLETTGARNPTLTIQALAWCTAQHLSTHWTEIAA
jgi:hypothetical protein